MATNPSFSIVPAEKFVLLIPRFLSSIMMHLNVDDEIKTGLRLMKWAVNHPSKFKNFEHEDKDGNTVYSTRRVFFAFFLALMQTLIGIVIEVEIIVYLASLSNLLDIIMRFVSMAAIRNFDNIYAAALHEEKLSAVAGKHLPIEYKRYMGRLYDE